MCKIFGALPVPATVTWGQGVRGQSWPTTSPFFEEPELDSKVPLVQPHPSSQPVRRSPPPSLLHIWLPPERSFGEPTRMFLFPGRKEELRSETTDFKQERGTGDGPHTACCWATMMNSVCSPVRFLLPRRVLAHFFYFIFCISPHIHHQSIA